MVSSLESIAFSLTTNQPPRLTQRVIYHLPYTSPPIYLLARDLPT